MAVLKCKMCGGDIEVHADQSYGTCDSCGSTMTLPRVSDEKKANLYNRANHFRRQNEFDRATAAYEQILNEDNTEAEAHWGVVLSKYGIEYVEDPQTRQLVPTCHRVQTDPVLSDPDYLAALEYAPDGSTRALYEKEAQAISAIQKSILEISAREQDYDVFICYKELSDAGTRTQDSALAQDIYYQLEKEGFRTFFSRITLENRLGQQYEPYIFAALNSAKVMLAVGTRPEYFNAPWVKNEWSRYLALMKTDTGKALIPCYRDMGPYDLPEALSMLQSQDMSKIGFMQDLIRGIRKITGQDRPQEAAPQAGAAEGTIGPLLKRAYIFLSDGDFEPAAQYFDKVLDMDPELAEAYAGRLCAELRVRSREGLSAGLVPLARFSSYNNALRFSDSALRRELEGYNEAILKKLQLQEKEQIYQEAMALKSGQRTAQEYRDAAARLRYINGFRDAGEQAAECERMAIDADARAQQTQLEEQHRREQARIAKEERKKKYKKFGVIGAVAAVAVALIAVLAVNVLVPAGHYNDGIAALENREYEAAAQAFSEAGDYRDAQEKLREASYLQAQAVEEQNDPSTILGAIAYYRQAIPYGDSMQKYLDITGRLEGTIADGGTFAVGLEQDGTVITAGDTDDGRIDVGAWTDIVQVSAGESYTAGLKADGTVVATGMNTFGQLNVSGWTDVISIATGDEHTVGLKADGTVVATGSNWMGKGNISDWTDIVAIAAGTDHTLGLKRDGTVLALGFNLSGKENVDGWSNIVAVAGGDEHTIGLRADGTVVATGSNKYGQCDTAEWADIVSIAAGRNHSVGLRKDGTVVATGDSENSDVSGWTDTIAVFAGAADTVGLKADGTVVAVGGNGRYQPDMESWTLF